MSSRRVPHESMHTPAYTSHAAPLMNAMKCMSQKELAVLMKLSEKLAQDTYEKWQQLSLAPRDDTHGHALLTYTGDVYSGLQADTWNTLEIHFAQKHLRILSGLYGIVSPLDGICPYRLEMGLSWKIHGGQRLVEYWSSHISQSIAQTIEITSSSCLLNLASEEYAQCVDKKKINAPVVEVSFFEWKNGRTAFASFHAKRARGLMAAFVVKNAITDPALLTGFCAEGYTINTEASTVHHLVFIRKPASTQ